MFATAIRDVFFISVSLFYFNSPFKDIDSNVGCTVTSLEVENSIFSSARRSIPPSAMLPMIFICNLKIVYQVEEWSFGDMDTLKG